jgi:hypothetical protein
MVTILRNKTGFWLKLREEYIVTLQLIICYHPVYFPEHNKFEGLKHNKFLLIVVQMFHVGMASYFEGKGILSHSLHGAEPFLRR